MLGNVSRDKVTFNYKEFQRNEHNFNWEKFWLDFNKLEKPFMTKAEMQQWMSDENLK